MTLNTARTITQNLRDRMSTVVWGAGAGLVLLAVAACEDQPTTSVSIETDNAWEFVQAPMANGGLYVDVSGTPFDDLDMDVEDTVLTAMTTATTWTATPNYTGDKASAGDPSVWVVVTFNGGDRRPCTQTPPIPGGGPEATGRVDILATLCGNEVALAQVSGHLTGAESMADPKFEALVRQTTRELLRP
jgi:hypothetical protein